MTPHKSLLSCRSALKSHSRAFFLRRAYSTDIQNGSSISTAVHQHPQEFDSKALSSLLSNFQKDSTLFRNKLFYDAVQKMSQDPSLQLNANDVKNALSVAARQHSLYFLRRALYKVASDFSKDLKNDENYKLLMSMSGHDDFIKENPLYNAWNIVRRGSKKRYSEKVQELFDQEYPDLSKADIDAKLLNWMTVLSANRNIAKLSSLNKVLFAALEKKYSKKDFTKQSVRREYFNQMQALSQFEFDAYYALCLRRVPKNNNKYKRKSSKAFRKWLSFTSQRYFFKSFRYQQTSKHQKRHIAERDEDVQKYYQDLVPSTYIFTKSIILLARYQQWERAALLYREAQQRNIGMRAVSGYGKRFYPIREKLNNYLQFGHVDPMQANIGKIFDVSRTDRARHVSSLKTAMEQM